MHTALGLADANEAISINLFREKDSEQGKDAQVAPVWEEPFHPDHTYSIFGEEEKIFGYQDLHVDLNFRAHDMRPRLDVRYKKEWKPLGETKAMDIKAMLKEFLPDCKTHARLNSDG